MKAKPCPFCGRIYTGKHITMLGKAEPFECPRCGAHGPLVDYKKNQVRGKPQKYYDKLTLEAWNRRAPSEASDEV